jgi:transcriptional regulator with XRE-family HTH domain
MAAARGQAERRRLDFGARVRRIRSDRGLSQEALAELAGLHRTYVGSVERGERNVSLDQIHRLADGLRVPVRDLFEDDPTRLGAG